GGSGGNSDVITREQIMATEGVRNMYELVQRLRPRWLTMRSQDRSFGMATEIAVFQGQTYLGNIETLRQLGHTMAYELRWMDGPTAMSTLSGAGAGKHLSGAIIIVTTPPSGG
ncbi:MAG: hypothetical protein Q8N53_10695, partial [Longimicrobiales bacterium]|nr:hypothetical protein [Longimicrobiales bacterium]